MSELSKLNPKVFWHRFFASKNRFCLQIQNMINPKLQRNFLESNESILNLSILDKETLLKSELIDDDSDSQIYDLDFNIPLTKINSSISSLPHEKKIDKGGEDAYYIAEKILVVADGVGGWKRNGIDPSLFARDLCKNIGDEYKKLTKIQESSCKEIVEKALENTKATGSSTCCMLLFDTDKNIIHSLNLGDSGYVIVRPTNEEVKIIYRSEEQQHSFNFPYQLGTNGDTPDKAIYNSHICQKNDIIILATDG